MTRHSMTKGVRWIRGQEYLLNGRYSDKTKAIEAAADLRKSWLKVRIIKLWDYDFLVYVHGSMRRTVLCFKGEEYELKPVPALVSKGESLRIGPTVRNT